MQTGDEAHVGAWVNEAASSGPAKGDQNHTLYIHITRSMMLIGLNSGTRETWPICLLHFHSREHWYNSEHLYSADENQKVKQGSTQQSKYLRQVGAAVMKIIYKCKMRQCLILKKKIYWINTRNRICIKSESLVSWSMAKPLPYNIKHTLNLFGKGQEILNLFYFY